MDVIEFGEDAADCNGVSFERGGMLRRPTVA